MIYYFCYLLFHLFIDSFICIVAKPFATPFAKPFAESLSQCSRKGFRKAFIYLTHKVCAERISYPCVPHFAEGLAKGCAKGVAKGVDQILHTNPHITKFTNFPKNTKYELWNL